MVCPMSYTLKAGSCIKCSANNCVSCNSDNSTECYGCKPTYYLNDAGTCQTCPS